MQWRAGLLLSPSSCFATESVRTTNVCSSAGKPLPNSLRLESSSSLRNDSGVGRALLAPAIANAALVSGKRMSGPRAQRVSAGVSAGAGGCGGASLPGCALGALTGVAKPPESPSPSSPAACCCSPRRCAAELEALTPPEGVRGAAEAESAAAAEAAAEAAAALQAVRAAHSDSASAGACAEVK